jgi:hypothetical protein
MTWENNNVYGASTQYYNDTDQTGSNGNISQDPMFADEANDDFTLVWGSTCIDAGQDVSGWGVDTDLNGDTREQGLDVDMGAIESY